MEADRVVAEIQGSGECVRATLASLLDEQFVLFLMRRLVDHVARSDGAQGPALRLEKIRQRACLDNVSGVQV